MSASTLKAIHQGFAIRIMMLKTQENIINGEC
jgi:hypothetical protein